MTVIYYESISINGKKNSPGALCLQISSTYNFIFLKKTRRASSVQWCTVKSILLYGWYFGFSNTHYLRYPLLISLFV